MTRSSWRPRHHVIEFALGGPSGGLGNHRRRAALESGRPCEDDDMEYDPTQYIGAAPDYLRGRPPYSADLAAVLAAELQLDGTGRLLDVGSGPGTVGVQLAPLFEHVTFLEPDPDMLAE